MHQIDIFIEAPIDYTQIRINYLFEIIHHNFSLCCVIFRKFN